MVPLRVEAAARQGMRRDMHETLGAALGDLPPERIEPAHQRAVGMDGTALRAEKDAGAVFLVREVESFAILREAGAELRRAHALVRRQPRGLIGIELDKLVVTAMRTAAAHEAERLGAGFR